MQHWLPYFIALAATACVIYGTVRHFRQKRRLQAKLRTSFGAVPERKKLFSAEYYWQTYVPLHTGATFVDDLTWQNLDMDEVYQRVNACHSEIGDIFLYKQLRQTRLPEEELDGQEKFVCALQADSAAMFRLMYLLSRIGRSGTGSLAALTLESAPIPRRQKLLVLVLASLPFVSIFLLLAGVQVFGLILLLSLLANLVASYVLKSSLPAYHTMLPLAEALYWSKKMLPLLRGLDPKLAAQMEKRRNICAKAGTPLAVMRYSEHLKEAALLDLFGCLLLPILCYFWADRFVNKNRSATENLFEDVARVDIACAVCSLRESLPFFTAPEFDGTRALSAQQLYHPLLAHPVANDITAGKGVLLTGSNASGKSTFLKALAVNCLLAQTLNTCCAQHFRMQRADVLTAMAVSDDIIEGDSYFIAEIKSMKRLVDAVSRDAFAYLFIDEILKGTNTVERIGAAFSFLRYFSGKNALCFAATHDLELVSMVAGLYDNYHFSETIRNNEVSFTYRLEPGPATSRNALKLLQVKGFPPEIVDTANELVQNYARTHRWNTAQNPV